MKRVPLLMAAALVPLAVSAGERNDLVDWDVETIKADERVTDIMGAEVYSADGQEIGEVRDVVFDSDGISSILFMPNTRQEVTSGKRVVTPADPQDTDVYPSAEAAARDNMADAPNVRQEQPTGDDFQEQQSQTLMREAAHAGVGSMALLDWNDVTYDASRDAVILKSDQADFKDASAFMEGKSDDEQSGTGSGDRTSTSASANEVPANTVLGMDVNLSNEDSFGRVEDVLVSDSGETTAYVVDSWDLVDKKRYAVPAEASTVDAEANEINLDYSKEDLVTLEEFEFDQLETNQQ